MKIVLSYLLLFVGRHWLRIAILVGFLFLMTKKQVGLNIQLGQSPGLAQVKSISSPEGIEGGSTGLFGSWRFFGPRKSTPTLFTQLRRMEEAKITAFLNRFSVVAEREQEEFGVPSSIILSNALLQSGAGGSTLVERGNNFFGLSCTPDWRGPELNVDGKCYRAYQNAFMSFRDHSLFITTGSYSDMQKLSKTDYKAWAKRLEEKGYNGMPEIEEQILSTIDRWQLFRFDQ